jgi:hypothetical protein
MHRDDEAMPLGHRSKRTIAVRYKTFRPAFDFAARM